MKKSPKHLANLLQAVAAAGKALRGREIDVMAYVVALAAIEAVTRIGICYLKLQAGILV